MKKLNVDEQKLRDLYLRKLALGEIQGPLTGYPGKDKPWLKYYDEEAIIKDGPKCSVYEMIYQSNKDYLENNAIQYFNRYITYRELFEGIEAVARSLKMNGINEGDIVSVLLPNIPESVYLFYALSKIGAIANMIDPRSSEKDILHYINEVDSELVIALDDPETNAVLKVKNIIAKTNVQKIVKVAATNSLLNDGQEEKITENSKIICNFNAFLAEGADYVGTTEVTYAANRAVVIEHTGGTTGIPKGVLLSNDAINMIVHHFMVSGLLFERDQKWLNIMPPFIAYGVGNGLHLPLAIGMCVVAVPKFEPNKIDELIDLYRPNNFAGVPIHYESIIHSDKLKDVDFSKWILPGVGGDTMDADLEREANEFLREHNSLTDVIKGYGLTEVCGGACANFGKANAIGSVGIPFSRNNIAIFEPNIGNNLGLDERELPYNTRGEICIASPSMMLEYYKNHIETEAVLRKHSDGQVWMHTGDIGYMNENGLLFIDGRIKRVIIRYDGFKIYPFGIENLINSFPEVDFCKVVATPDVNHVQGNLPQANIILKPEYKDQEEAIIKKIKDVCNHGLAEYAIPSDYQVVEEFPRTPIGKVDYVAMENKNKEKVKRRVR